MELEVFVIALGCFVAAIVNSALATGGVYIMLAASSAVLPLTAAIPMQAALGAPSLLARIFLFWKDINWAIFLMFAPMAAIGCVVGVWVFVSLNDAVIALLLGFLLLLLVWAIPRGVSLDLPRRFLAVGGLHGFFGTVFGVGLFLQPAILRTSLTRTQITGTLAVCLLSLDVVKAAGYVGVDFDYKAYIPHILAGAVSGILGSVVGKRIGIGISEQMFRVIFKVIVTLAAARLLIKGLSGLVGN